MNPRLVRCLFAAIAVGFAAAAWALSAGWHPLLALPAFSVSGSFALVVFTLITLPTPRPMAAPAETAPA